MVIIIFVFGLYLFSKDDVYINDSDSIRFRVIANSNSVRDVMIKKLVVNELSSFLFNNESIEDTRKNIVNNMDLINNKINDLFFNNNYDLSFNVLYGMNEFPRKEYNGIVYEEGMYESLVVEIGEAKGDNYWCFLYPSLCMIDIENDIKYKSKILEFLSDILM